MPSPLEICKKMAELYLAISEGKQIQFKSVSTGDWHPGGHTQTVPVVSDFRESLDTWRIKPDDPDEIWQCAYRYDGQPGLQYGYYTQKFIDEKNQCSGRFYVGRRLFRAVDQDFVK